MTITFKTSEECGLELVSCTTMAPFDGTETFDDIEDADWLPVRAARASFSAQDKTGNNVEADRKLLSFLSREGHWSCFEHNYATFLVECPLFIAAQFMRHKSLSFNQTSRRYTSDDIGFWIPDKWRKQAEKNKQCSTDEEVSGEVVIKEWVGGSAYANIEGHSRMSYMLYRGLLANGVCREQARAVLPQSLLTRFYATGSLRNLKHFIDARTADDSQPEIRVIAQRIKEKLFEIWPESMKALFPE